MTARAMAWCRVSGPLSGSWSLNILTRSVRARSSLMLRSIGSLVTAHPLIASASKLALNSF